MLKIKPFRQKSGLCGPATLKMVFSYYGVNKSEASIAGETGCDPEYGIEAVRMLDYARELGFDGYIQDDSTLEDLKRLVVKEQTPVIVDWFSEDDGHYSVVVDIDDENIYILDPELGYIRAMRHSRFYRVWFDFPGEYIKDDNDLTIRRMIVITSSKNK